MFRIPTLRDPIAAPSPSDPACPADAAPGASGDTAARPGAVYAAERLDAAGPRPAPSGARARPRGTLSWATDPRVGLAFHPGLALHALEPDD